MSGADTTKRNIPAPRVTGWTDQELQAARERVDEALDFLIQEAFDNNDDEARQ